MPAIPLDLATLAVGVAFVLGVLIDRAWWLWASRDE